MNKRLFQVFAIAAALCACSTIPQVIDQERENTRQIEGARKLTAEQREQQERARNLERMRQQNR